jgi:hypothetical protein
MLCKQIKGISAVLNLLIIHESVGPTNILEMRASPLDDPHRVQSLLSSNRLTNLKKGRRSGLPLGQKDCIQNSKTWNRSAPKSISQPAPPPSRSETSMSADEQFLLSQQTESTNATGSTMRIPLLARTSDRHRDELTNHPLDSAFSSSWIPTIPRCHSSADMYLPFLALLKAATVTGDDAMSPIL